MVLKPVNRNVVPSPLENQNKFDDFVTQYLNKCDDLISYTRRYPVVKQTETMTVQRQNRNPHEAHRWLRRNIAIRDSSITYDELRAVLFVNRADHLARWVPQLAAVERVEAIVPNLCDVFRLAFRTQGLQARRDYCQLVIKRELVGSAAKPKPRLYTPSASMANLALHARSQSSASLAVFNGDRPPMSPTNLGAFNGDRPPMSPTNVSHKGLKSARSFVDLHDHNSHHTPPPMPRLNIMPATQYAGLSPQDSFRQVVPQNTYASDGEEDDDEDGQSEASTQPLRRFQIVSVPVLHGSCTTQRGHVRAYYESYEEVREYADGSVEWICIHHSDYAGWVPSFMSDRSIASAFPKEGEALMKYVKTRHI
ncbi:hypothetical protein EV175_004254 [Coemansia sp. RSA 1933]|nr:hypothetical protein EV175_004254 [Coemansia sp. RSA 1933]